MIFVTGATGFIGRSLMASFEREGIEAKAYDGRLITHLRLREQLEGAHTVIHLAGAESRGRDRLLRQVDLEGTQQLIAECERAGIEHLIIPSRIGANVASMHTLLRAKGQVERMVVRSGIPYTILRAPSLYGRGDRFTELFLSLALWSWPLVWLPGGGKTPLQPLWVEDYARCLLAVINEPAHYSNRALDIAGEERFSYGDFMGSLLAVAGSHRQPLSLPLVLLRPVTRLFLQWWYWPPVTQYVVDRFFAPELTDTDAVLREFGFRPARLVNQIVYLRRPGRRRRLFQR